MAKEKYEIKSLIKETERAYKIETITGEQEWMPKKNSAIHFESGKVYLLCEKWSWESKFKKKKWNPTPIQTQHIPDGFEPFGVPSSTSTSIIEGKSNADLESLKLLLTLTLNEINKVLKGR